MKVIITSFQSQFGLNFMRKAIDAWEVAAEEERERRWRLAREVAGPPYRGVKLSQRQERQKKKEEEKVSNAFNNNNAANKRVDMVI